MILTLRQELYRRLGSTSDNVTTVPVLGDLVLFVCFLFKILLKKYSLSEGLTPVILALKRLRQEECCEFKVHLDFRAKPTQRNPVFLTSITVKIKA